METLKKKLTIHVPEQYFHIEFSSVGGLFARLKTVLKEMRVLFCLDGKEVVSGSALATSKFYDEAITLTITLPKELIYANYASWYPRKNSLAMDALKDIITFSYLYSFGNLKVDADSWSIFPELHANVSNTSPLLDSGFIELRSPTESGQRMAKIQQLAIKNLRGTCTIHKFVVTEKGLRCFVACWEKGMAFTKLPESARDAFIYAREEIKRIDAAKPRT